LTERERFFWASSGKEDGERVFITARPNEPLSIINMHNTVYPESLLPPCIVSDIRHALPQTPFMGDGEFISRDGDLYDFLSARAHLDERLALRLWHVLTLPLTTPLLDVKNYLEENVAQNDTVSLVPYTLLHSKQDILDYFKKTSQTYEGIVVKPNLGYAAKWLKMRKMTTQDVVILGIKKTDEWVKNRCPATFLIGGYDASTHTFQRIGDVSSGLRREQKDAIGTVLSQKPLAEDKEYLYVQPAAVLEIAYHQRMENGLRFPKINRVRFDKRPEDCPLF